MEQAPVPFVRSRFCDQAQISRHGRTVFRRQHTFHDLHFGHGLRAHDVDLVITSKPADRRRARVAVGVRSVRRDRHGAAAEPIQSETIAGLAIGRRLPPGEPGPDFENVRDIAVDHRQASDLESLQA